MPNYPNGCHLCEVEIDPETGSVDVARYTAVDDVGRAVNPLLLAGQVHGGVAQGIDGGLLASLLQDGKLVVVTPQEMDWLNKMAA